MITNFYTYVISNVEHCETYWKGLKPKTRPPVLDSTYINIHDTKAGAKDYDATYTFVPPPPAPEEQPPIDDDEYMNGDGEHIHID